MQKIHRMPVERAIFQSKFSIWMSHAKLPGVSALAVIAKLGKSEFGSAMK
jgi:hypothetical protein